MNNKTLWRAAVRSAPLLCALSAALSGAGAHAQNCSLDEAVRAVEARSDLDALAASLFEIERSDVGARLVRPLPDFGYSAELNPDRDADSLHALLVGFSFGLGRVRDDGRRLLDALERSAGVQRDRLVATATIEAERLWSASARDGARIAELERWLDAVDDARAHLAALADAAEAARIDVVRLEREHVRTSLELAVASELAAASAARLALLTDGRCHAAAPLSLELPRGTIDSSVLIESSIDAEASVLEHRRDLVLALERPIIRLELGPLFTSTRDDLFVGAALGVGLELPHRRRAELEAASLEAELDALRTVRARLEAERLALTHIADAAERLERVALDARDATARLNLELEHAALAAWRSGEIDTFALLDALGAAHADNLYLIDLFAAARTLDIEARAALLETLP